MKPTNIAFSRGGVPKLLDFGLASMLAEAAAVDLTPVTATDNAASRQRAMEPDYKEGDDRRGDRIETTATQALLISGRRIAGTPLYMSPEAAGGAEKDADFDVWSLTLVLYEAIAGCHPFMAPTVPEVLRKVRRAVVPDVRRFRPSCPAPVADVLACALAPDRWRRPRTARELERLLATIL